MILPCPFCGHNTTYSSDDYLHDSMGIYVRCKKCSMELCVEFSVETVKIDNKPLLKPVSEVLKTGSVISIFNPEHVWHNEIGVLRQYNQPFCRVEFRGKLIRVPVAWIRPHEPNTTDGRSR